MKASAKIALGVACAMGAGMVFGLLIAPDKGIETRKRLKKTAGSWVDRLGNILADGQDILEGVKENSTSFKELGKEKAMHS
jgi:gas vesicle protein